MQINKCNGHRSVKDVKFICFYHMHKVKIMLRNN